jgi:molybdenum cofactor cytidylyltransferase
VTEIRQVPGLAALLLAAGAASRFGTPKQLARIGGLALVVHAARELAPVCGAGVLVVTGAWHEEVTGALAGEAVRCVYNPAWREGMGASIRQGVAALGAGADAVLLAVADQPGVTRTDYAQLAAAWQQAPGQPAAAVYAGAAGVPAIFPRTHFPALARLQGDQGARSLLRGAAQLTRIEMPAAAWDVDRPADLDKPEA